MSLAPLEGERVPLRRAGVPGPQGGGMYLSRVQYTRMLDAALGVVGDEGVKGISATRVSGRAGMSTKTFYDLFADREDCFLAVFDRVVEELAAVVGPVWEAEEAGGEWVERVRSALTMLLGALEREPALGKVVFLEALGAGPRVLVRRAEVLDRVAGFIDEGRAGSPLAEVLPSLTGAGVVGAAFSVIHARLARDAQESQEPGPSLMELVGPVMATVVLPYRGREVSARELDVRYPSSPSFLSVWGSRIAPKIVLWMCRRWIWRSCVLPGVRSWFLPRLLGVLVGVIVSLGKQRGLQIRRRFRRCSHGCGSMGWLRIVVGGRRGWRKPGG